MQKRALISGITGQDGSYLADLLLHKGYDVFGILPHRARPNFTNIQEILDRITLIDGDMTDSHSLALAVQEASPHEVYNLAAQSFVGKSWTCPDYTHDVTCLGLVRLLRACREYAPEARIYQASSSEMFGPSSAPQSERTPFNPVSPYAVAKVAAHLAARNHRDRYDAFVACGILFNHESERRGEHFVTQKIAKAAALIKAGQRDKLQLGDLSARRDWGYAPDYVTAMWMMLQQDEPHEYVIGTGQSYSVENFATWAFEEVGLNWRDHVVFDDSLVRPQEIPVLLADPSLAAKELGWKPAVEIRPMIRRMVRHWTSQYSPESV